MSGIRQKDQWWKTKLSTPFSLISLQRFIFSLCWSLPITSLHLELLQWVKDISEAGGASYTFHLEATGEFLPAPHFLTVSFSSTSSDLLLRLSLLWRSILNSSQLDHFNLTPSDFSKSFSSIPTHNFNHNLSLILNLNDFNWYWYCIQTDDPLDVVRQIRATKMKAAVAINPGTPSSEISNELGEAVDMILVMTVWPGESFELLHKNIWKAKLKELRKEGRLGRRLQCGGGTNFGSKGPEDENSFRKDSNVYPPKLRSFIQAWTLEGPILEALKYRGTRRGK